MARYNQPVEGTSNWHEPLNENFANLGIEVTNEVATFADLPEPTGETSPSGTSRRYLVRENRTVFRDAGESWEADAGLGAEDNPVPGTGHFENIQTDEFFTVRGTTVADIADAVANHNYVKLRSGVTYTHDGDSTISVSPSSHLHIDAGGATIQCRGTVIRRTDSSGSGFFDGSMTWVGGQFEGSQSNGEIPFHLSDALGDDIHPHRIKDCEIGVAVENSAEWSEIFSVSFRGRNNLCDLAVVGIDHSTGTPGSYPPGASLPSPTDNGGTYSFRDINVSLFSSPRRPDNGWEKSYGIWTDHAKCYEGRFDRVSVNVDKGVVGFRMHQNFEAARIHFWSETPGQKQGGTAIQVDKMIRSPNWVGGHIVTAGGTTKVAGKESKPFGMEMAEKSRSGGSRFWRRFEVNGEEVSAWINEGGGDYRKEFANNFRARFKKNGSSTKPTVEIGRNGAGLFVNGSGELVAVDEAGNTSRLT